MQRNRTASLHELVAQPSPLCCLRYVDALFLSRYVGTRPVFHHLAFLLLSSILTLSMSSLSLWHCHCWTFTRVLLTTTSPLPPHLNLLVSHQCLPSPIPLASYLHSCLPSQQHHWQLSSNSSCHHSWCVVIPGHMMYVFSLLLGAVYDAFSQGPCCIYHTITILMGSIYHTWGKNEGVN